MLPRAVEIWFVLLIMAVLNGTVREAFITRRFGAYAAHVISTAMLSTVIAVIAWMSIGWIGTTSTADAFVVGLTWLVLTVAFEFLAGHYLFRNSWEKLLADYNVLHGRIWIVVLLSTLLAPIWAHWQHKDGPPMSLSSAIILMVTAWLCAGAVLQFTRMVREWRRLTGVRLVTCTATGHPAAVRLDAVRAVVTAPASTSPKSLIIDCSLWAAGGPCDQGCITEAFAPESTPRNIVARWYGNKKCVYCAKPISAPESCGHRAALVGPQGTTREWSEVPVDRLLDSLRTDSPVCWNCHVAETLRRTRPDLVTDRPWPKNPERRAS